MRKILLALIAIVIVNSSAMAQTATGTTTAPTGLRESEINFLKQLQEQKTTTDPKKSSPTKTYQYVKEEETENSQCQVALTKIDKFILEIEDLKTATSIDTNKLHLKIKSLESQIARYKTQAKQFCSADLLKQSIHMKH